MICGACPNQHHVRFVCIEHQIVDGEPPFDRLGIGLELGWVSADRVSLYCKEQLGIISVLMITDSMAPDEVANR